MPTDACQFFYTCHCSARLRPKKGDCCVFCPVDLDSGAPQDAARVEERIRSAFANIDEVSEGAGLSETRRGWIDKARRLIPKLRANIAFLHGQLDLRHHSLHRLSQRRLATMTVIHNFHIQRTGGSTAAERFFSLRLEPLFEWLLDNLGPPPRPRASRQWRAA